MIVKKESTPIRDKWMLFLTGFIQVYFVAVNTFFLSRVMYVGVIFASFMISLVWSFNVKKVAFGTNMDRVIYALGATSGSVIGLWSSSVLFELL